MADGLGLLLKIVFGVIIAVLAGLILFRLYSALTYIIDICIILAIIILVFAGIFILLRRRGWGKQKVVLIIGIMVIITILAITEQNFQLLDDKNRDDIDSYLDDINSSILDKIGDDLIENAEKIALKLIQKPSTPIKDPYTEKPSTPSPYIEPEPDPYDPDPNP